MIPALGLGLPPQRLNVPIETIHANVERNIRRGLPQLQPYARQDREMLIAAGGPSLNDHLDEIRALRETGAALATVNGTHDYLAHKHGIEPSLFALLDARPHNVRFVQRPIVACKYFIASQCDPAVFDALDGHDVTIWHSPAGDDPREVFDRYYFGPRHYILVPGGTTVTNRLISLVRYLGFCRVQVFGWDSCFRGAVNHAYPQPENDEDKRIGFTLAGREFEAAPWMLKQANDFLGYVRDLGEGLDLIVRGDGLIATLLKIAHDRQEMRKWKEALDAAA